MRKPLLVAFVMATLTGCSVGGPEEGTVLEKRFEEARTYEEYNYCKTRYPVTKTRVNYDGDLETYTDWECQGGYETRYDDEDYMIHIEKCEGEERKGVTDSDGKPKERKCKDGWREIDPQRFATLKVGDYYAKEKA